MGYCNGSKAVAGNPDIMEAISDESDGMYGVFIFYFFTYLFIYYNNNNNKIIIYIRMGWIIVYGHIFYILQKQLDKYYHYVINVDWDQLFYICHNQPMHTDHIQILLYHY